MSQADENQAEDISNFTVKYSRSDAATYDGHEYRIKGIRMEGDFEIGLTHIGGGVPPSDIVPAEIYDAVESRIRSQIDVGTVESKTTVEYWPTLGTLELIQVDDNEVKVNLN